MIRRLLVALLVVDHADVRAGTGEGPGGGPCLSHLQSFLGWTGRRTRTVFHIAQARYYIAQVKDEMAAI